MEVTKHKDTVYLSGDVPESLKDLCLYNSAKARYYVSEEKFNNWTHNNNKLGELVQKGIEKKIIDTISTLNSEVIEDLLSSKYMYCSPLEFIKALEEIHGSESGHTE